MRKLQESDIKIGNRIKWLADPSMEGEIIKTTINNWGERIFRIRKKSGDISSWYCNDGLMRLVSEEACFENSTELIKCKNFQIIRITTKKERI